MTKVFCDICGAEKDNNLQICKKKMITHYAASEWQVGEMDVCGNCLKKLENLHELLESEFVKRKGKIKVKIEDDLEVKDDE